MRKRRAIVIGGSAGGVEALDRILPALPNALPAPVLIVQHLHPQDDGAFCERLAHTSALPVVEPSDKQPIEPGRVYTAPANYHMLVEHDMTISLSIDEKVNWSRPSIDVLFASAARVWADRLIAVLLSGANNDGARGLHHIRSAGGWTIAQCPTDATSPVMPQAAIAAGAACETLPADRIAARLVELLAAPPAGFPRNDPSPPGGVETR